MTGIIDVGGGNRGVYGAGVFERLMEENVHLDCCVGVSAGSANAITFFAGQKSRLYRFYHDYSFRDEYMGFKYYRKNGQYLNLEYIYSTLTNSDGEDPIDYESVLKYDGIGEAVVTNALTGEPEYISFKSMQKDNYLPLSASCTLPIICKPTFIDGIPYYDGGVSDPIPLDRAEKLGCDKIIIILTRPKDYIKPVGAEVKLAKLIKSKYPATADLLARRAQMYNDAVAKAIKAEQEGKCLIIAPDDCCGVNTLKKTPESIDTLYNKGIKDAEAILSFI